MNALQQRILLYRIQQLKDTQAFQQLFDAFAPRIFRYVSMKVSREMDAEDIVSETFYKAWKYFLGEEAIAYPQALLFRIARLTVADHYRVQESTEELADDMAVTEAQVLPDRLDAKHAVERVRSALSQLKASYKEVIVLRYFEEMDVQEIADALDKTPGNVRVLLHRAVAALEKLLS